MISVKDFTKGDTVYLLQRNIGRNARPSVSEDTVVSVGRKYVTVTRDRRFQDWNADYLYEKTRCGEALLLFATKEAAEEYIEKNDLAVWIGNFSVSDAEKLSLSQLRQIGNIITNQEQTKP